jgi:hypothetical protein
MAMVEDFAHAPSCALGDLACALSRTHADILAGNACTFANVFGSSSRVEGHQIARTFPDTLGRRSSSFGSALSDIARSTANIAAGTARMSL